MAVTSFFYGSGYINEDNPYNVINQDGRLDWVNPESGGSSVNYTTCIVGNEKESSYLYASGLNVSNIVPNGATVDGVEVTVVRKSSHSTQIQDEEVDLIIDGSLGTNKASGEWWDTSDETINYGGSSDVWGHGSITPEQLESGTVRFVCWGDANAEHTASVKEVKVKVHYTEATDFHIYENYYRQLLAGGI